MRIKRTSHRQPEESPTVSAKKAASIKNITYGTLTSAKTSVASAKESIIRKIRRNAPSLVPLGVAAVMLLVVVLGNTRSNDGTQEIARISGLGGVSALDEVSSADIAARIAAGADLIVADNVQNLADSQKAQIEFAATEGSYLTKPQLVSTDAKTKNDITTYVVQEGDTISSIARRFNITSDTIRWENDITGNIVAPGRKLSILPVSGIRYKVESGDTVKSIAERFDANEAQIIAFNDAEIRGLKSGDRIIIPEGEQPVRQQTYFSSGYGFAFGSQPLYGGNGYGYGYCTWHAANRRAAVGKPIPRNLGNAVTWATLAAQAGLGVGEQPREHAVLWHKNTYIAGGLGHVAFVERMNPDGSIYVSDMNYVGWNTVSYRTVSPSEFGQYLFIY